MSSEGGFDVGAFFCVLSLCLKMKMKMYHLNLRAIKSASG